MVSKQRLWSFKKVSFAIRKSFNISRMRLVIFICCQEYAISEIGGTGYRITHKTTETSGISASMRILMSRWLSNHEHVICLYVLIPSEQWRSQEFFWYGRTPIQSKGSHTFLNTRGRYSNFFYPGAGFPSPGDALARPGLPTPLNRCINVLYM